MELSALWDSLGFDQTALTPEAQSSKASRYSLEPGPGEVLGIRLTRYGRYGNNLLQMGIAIAVARKLGWRWVQVCQTDFMRTFDQIEADGIALLHPQQPSPEGVRFLTGPFIGRQNFRPRLPSLPQSELHRIISKWVRPMLQIPVAPVPDDELVVHIRSGDLFGSNPHRAYGQPPLSFYTLIIEALRKAGEIQRVCLVFEDAKNPCVSALADYLDRIGMPFRIQSGSFAEDVAVICGARRVVFGVGTFGLGMAASSERMREVYCFRQPGFKTLPDLERVWVVDAADDYIPRRGWLGTPDQLSAMIHYPVEKLTLSHGDQQRPTDLRHA